MLEHENIQCPWCFETLPLDIDPSGGRDQDFVIDCEVCCRPMRIRLRRDVEDGIAIEVDRE